MNINIMCKFFCSYNQKLIIQCFILILFLFKCIESLHYNNDSVNIRQKKEIIIDRSKMFGKTLLKYFVNRTLNPFLIDSALNRLRKKTCLTFIRITSTINADLKYDYGPFFYSNLGKTRHRTQFITLGSRNPSLTQIFMFTLRSLGMDFEHNRSDRNNYVTINRENIRRQFINYFYKSQRYRTSTYGFGYDYLSVMHFSGHDYSRNLLPTIVSKDQLMGPIMGISSKPSFNDIKLLNSFYCLDKCPKKLKCFNYGYTDPLNCDRCRCLPFFTGIFCERFKHNCTPCKRNNIIMVSKYKRSLRLKLRGKCNYILMAKTGRRIYFKSFQIKSRRVRCFCNSNEYVELRYRNDKSVSGIQFCPCVQEISKLSHDNQVILSTKFQEISHRLEFHFEYKAI